MRLIVTGKSRSGKSTALHRLIRTALQATWSHTLLADGKSVELLCYKTDTRHVFGEAEAETFAAAITAAANRLTERYKALRERDLVTAPASDPRELIVIDEVQEFSRHLKHGKAVLEVLTRIFEKSGALGDLVIVTTQRATNVIPPSARHNANADLRMLGVGFFQFVADGHPTRQGRVDPAAPLADADWLNPADLLDVLNTQAVDHPPTPITRYEGAPGSGAPMRYNITGSRKARAESISTAGYTPTRACCSTACTSAAQLRPPMPPSPISPKPPRSLCRAGPPCCSAM